MDTKDTLTPTEMLRRLGGVLTLAIRIVDHDPALVDHCAAAQQEIQEAIAKACETLGEVPLLQAKIGALRLAMVGLFEALGTAHVVGWTTVALTRDLRTAMPDVVETSLSGTTLVDAMNELVDAMTERNGHDRERAYMYYLSLVLGFSGDYARTDYANSKSNHRKTLTTLKEQLVKDGWLSDRSDLAVVAAPNDAAVRAPQAPWPLFLALSAAVVTLVAFVLIRHSQANTLQALQHAVDESPLARTGASPRTHR